MYPVTSRTAVDEAICLLFNNIPDYNQWDYSRYISLSIYIILYCLIGTPIILYRSSWREGYWCFGRDVGENRWCNQLQMLYLRTEYWNLLAMMTERKPNKADINHQAQSPPPPLFVFTLDPRDLWKALYRRVPIQEVWSYKANKWWGWIRWIRWIHWCHADLQKYVTLPSITNNPTRFQTYWAFFSPTLSIFLYLYENPSTVPVYQTSRLENVPQCQLLA